MMNFRIVQAAADPSADLYIYGDITEEAYFDNDVTPTNVIDILLP